MTTYFTLLTPTGLAKIANAQLTQNTVDITQVAVGDSNGVNYAPTGNETALKKERWRGGVASKNIDASNPNWIVVEAVIPSSVGGFTIREVALYDVDGDMIAIGNYPDTYKPLASDGSTMDLVLRTIIEVSNAASITLRIDPNVIVASRKYVDDKVSSVNSSVTNLQTALTAHLGQSVASEDGAHGLRYFNGKWEKEDTSGWNEIETGGTTYYAEAISTNGLDYTVTLDGVTEYVDGMTFTIKPNMTSTGVVRLNVNGLGFNYALHGNASIIQADEIRAGGMYTFCYAAEFSIPGSGKGNRFMMQGSNTLLESSITSASTSRAATANAVKMVNDKFKYPIPIKAALSVGWQPVNGPLGGAGDIVYSKDELGTVFVTGMVTRGANAGSTIFILPIGYRPSKDSVTYINYPSTLSVYPSGEVWCTDTRAGATIYIHTSFKASQ